LFRAMGWRRSPTGDVSSWKTPVEDWRHRGRKDKANSPGA
jgi:hypothetical protein